MRLRFVFALCCIGFLTSAGQAALAYTEEDVAAARLQHIAGDFAGALEVLVPAAEAGSAVAQNVVAVAYEDGLGLPKDAVKAMEWYTRAADQGMGKAMHNIGHLMWVGGVGVEADPAQARVWFRKAMDAGYVGAYANLGLLLERGEGGAKDMQGAFDVYQAGLAAGDLHSVNNLAHFYRLGDVVEEDMVRARALYAQAARMGLNNAWSNLGVMFRDAMGGPQDVDTAFLLFEAARSRGSAMGAMNLSHLIEDGLIDGRGPVDALAYCLHAETLNSDGMAEVDCTALSESLPAADREQAATLAAAL